MTTASTVWSRKRLLALVLAGLTFAIGLSLFSGRAWAVLVDVVENGTAGHLSMQSDPQPAEFLDMSPGSVEHWQISSNLVDASSPLTMQFKRDGELVTHPSGLVLQARLCSTEWTTFPAAPACAGGATNVFGPTAANSATFGTRAVNGAPVPGDAPTFDLGTLTNTPNRFLLVTMSIPDTPEARADDTLMGLEASLAFGHTASGNDPTNPPGPTGLPNTGADVAALALLALGALGLGAVLHSARRARADGRTSA